MKCQCLGVELGLLSGMVVTTSLYCNKLSWNLDMSSQRIKVYSNLYNMPGPVGRTRNIQRKYFDPCKSALCNNTYVISGIQYSVSATDTTNLLDSGGLLPNFRSLSGLT